MKIVLYIEYRRFLLVQCRFTFYEEMPLRLGGRLALCQREDDDIDYFEKCITGISRVCSPPRAYLSLRGPSLAGFKSQLLSVMELRTAVICGARSWARWGSSSWLENRRDGGVKNLEKK